MHVRFGRGLREKGWQQYLALSLPYTPDEITRERNLSAFKEALADAVRWETAHISTKEGIIYT